MDSPWLTRMSASSSSMLLTSSGVWTHAVISSSSRLFRANPLLLSPRYSGKSLERRLRFLRSACDRKKFSLVLVITTSTHFHTGLAWAFMYTTPIPIEFNRFPSAPLTDLVCVLFTFIFISLAIDRGARLMEAPVLQRTLVVIGSSVLFFVLGFIGDTSKE